MKEIYQEYIETKSSGDDFLKWLLIRKIKLWQQIIVIFVLLLSWVLVAPHLAYWLTFFLISLLLAILTYGVTFISKVLK